MSYQAVPPGNDIPDDVSQGVLLGDSSPTLTVAGGNLYTLPSTVALTANRTITLGVTGAATGELIAVRRRETSAFTLTVKDDAATTLFTFAAGLLREAGFQFDGTHFVFVGYVRLQ